MGDWNPKANELFLEALEPPIGTSAQMRSSTTRVMVMSGSRLK